jgi:hypothetical protein
MNKLLITLFLSIVSINANAECFLKTAVADAVSTEIAIENVNNAMEANPLDVNGVLGAKLAVYVGLKFADDATRETIESVTCPLQMGLFGNNMAVALGAESIVSGLAPVIGIVTGLLYLSGAEFGPVTELYPDDMEVN